MPSYHRGCRINWSGKYRRLHITREELLWVLNRPTLSAQTNRALGWAILNYIRERRANLAGVLARQVNLIRSRSRRGRRHLAAKELEALDRWIAGPPLKHLVEMAGLKVNGALLNVDYVRRRLLCAGQRKRLRKPNR